MGIEIGSTFIIQALNSIVLVMIIVGILFLVMKNFRHKQDVLEIQKRIEGKLDILLERNKQV